MFVGNVRWSVEGDDSFVGYTSVHYMAVDSLRLEILILLACE